MLWIATGTPPMRTMGDTRLWYALFVSVVGLIVYLRWRYRWILTFSTVMSVMFVAINVFRPELHVTPLMPALKSVWFVPHVTFYMISYALLGCSAILSVAGLINRRLNVTPALDSLVRSGVAFFTIAMIMGAVWAKQAWGEEWSWDPKETWAAITWLGYILYIHLRCRWTLNKKWLYLCLIASFAALQMCWWGINLLPSAEQSIHLFGR